MVTFHPDNFDPWFPDLSAEELFYADVMLELLNEGKSSGRWGNVEFSIDYTQEAQ